MHSLHDQGYVTYEHYGTISLTQAGKNKADLIRDRHAVLTRFLNEVLGVALDTAEADACKIEHVLSEETLQKLKQFVAGLCNAV